MNSTGARSDAGSGGGGSAGVADFGDLDVTFSAPFYTGVFLSSRELQGDCNYMVHQKIVANGMIGTLAQEWEYPKPGCESWQGTVSPLYFIGANLNDVSAVQIQKFKENILNLKNNYELNFLGIRVKFFEFGFGIVSIRFKKPNGDQNIASYVRDLKSMLLNCEEAVNCVLNSIANEVTKTYYSSVPCCIKNSDIWDIDNFAALESAEGVCKIGKVQEISIVAVTEEKCPATFNVLRGTLAKNLLYFSNQLLEAPVNATYRLFTDGGNLIIALGNSKNDKEIEYLSCANEMIVSSLVIEKYFKNFFYSYNNYISSEYEIIESKDNIFWKNIWNFKNLIEKFFDIQSLYFQIKDFVLKNMLTSNHSVYIAELYTIHPKLNTKINIFSITDENMKQFEKQFEQIKFLTKKYFAVSATILSIGISVAVVLLSISPALIDNDIDLWRIILIPSIFAVLLFSATLVITSFRLGSRKLYYLCKLQKKEYRKMFKDKKKKNKDKKDCVCGIKVCHRCQGGKWHSRVFYRDENLCFRCGINLVKLRKLFKEF